MSISTYGLQDIKKEMQHMPHEQLTVLCLRLARYKKENKELLAYLLFEAVDELAFAEKVKAEVGFMFSQLPSNNFLAVKNMDDTKPPANNPAVTKNAADLLRRSVG